MSWGMGHWFAHPRVPWEPPQSARHTGPLPRVWRRCQGALGGRAQCRVCPDLAFVLAGIRYTKQLTYLARLENHTEDQRPSLAHMARLVRGYLTEETFTKSAALASGRGADTALAAVLSLTEAWSGFRDLRATPAPEGQQSQACAFNDGLLALLDALLADVLTLDSGTRGEAQAQAQAAPATLEAACVYWTVHVASACRTPRNAGRLDTAWTQWARWAASDKNSRVQFGTPAALLGAI